MRIVPLSLLLIATAILAVGCRRGGDPVVTPPPPPPPPTAWLAADSASTADALAAEVVKRSWVNEFRDHTARVPVLRIGAINDRSDREIEVAQLARELTRALNTYTCVRVAAADGSPADYTLTGTVGFTETDQGATRYYQFDFRLQDPKGETIGTPFALERSKTMPGKTQDAPSGGASTAR